MQSLCTLLLSRCRLVLLAVSLGPYPVLLYPRTARVWNIRPPYNPYLSSYKVIQVHANFTPLWLTSRYLCFLRHPSFSLTHRVTLVTVINPACLHINTSGAPCLFSLSRCLPIANHCLLSRIRYRVRRYQGLSGVDTICFTYDSTSALTWRRRQGLKYLDLTSVSVRVSANVSINCIAGTQLSSVYRLSLCVRGQWPRCHRVRPQLGENTRTRLSDTRTRLSDTR